jgi:hypothetical protein
MKHKLFNLVTVAKNCGEKPPRSFGDYTTTSIEEIKAATPKGVEAIEML